MTRLRCFAIAAALAFAMPLAAAEPSPATFVGTTPCGDAVRAFIGLSGGAKCPAVLWNLTLGTVEDANRWRLTAIYGSPMITGMMDPTTVTKQGILVRTAIQRFGGESALFRLTDGASSIAFAQLGDDLVNVAREDGSLVPGTSAYSYTLTRAENVEPPVAEISRVSEGDYTLPPKETGPQVLGIFGGRSPCAGLARESRFADADGCVRIKWRVTLLRDPRTNQPTIYKVDNSLNRGRSWTGTWRIVRGAPGFPTATVYQLDAGTSHGAILFLAPDDNLLLFLNQQYQPLPGNKDFNYTLARSDP